MATESELRDSFRDPENGPHPEGGIDLDAVIRRSRSRRRPRQLLVGAVSALAVVGLAVPVIGAVGAGGGLSTAAGGRAESAAEQDRPLSGGDDGDAGMSTGPAPAEKLQLCGGPLAETTPAASGLVAAVEFPASAPTGSTVEGLVVLTNTGPAAVSGFTGSRPSITLAQGGIVLWHSNGPVDLRAVAIELAPGASMTLPATFDPVRCDAEDDAGESFRAGLPPLPAGGYQLSAALDVTLEGGTDGTTSATRELVTGPSAPISLG